MDNLIEFPDAQSTRAPQFEVDLDDHWRTWGYKQKKDAVNNLKRNYVAGHDFLVSQCESKKGQGGHNRVSFKLTAATAFRMQKTIQTEKMLGYREEQLEASAAAIEKVENLSGPELASIAMRKLLSENFDLIEQKGILVRQIHELEPKAESFDRFLSAENSRLLSQVAKDLKLKPNKLFRALRDDGFLYKREGSNVAIQELVNSGYFTHKTSTFNDTEGRAHNKTQVLVTSAGQDWLSKRYGKRPDLIA